MKIATDPAAALGRLKLPKSFVPTWELAGLFPGQGEWTDDDYLGMVERIEAGRLVELVDGHTEVLPMPTEEHQALILFLVDVLRAFANPRGLGKVSFAGIRVQLRPKTFRLPDVVFMSAKNRAKRDNRYWSGADLAMEVVSEDDPQRDLLDKRADYAAAGIKEYWIVDPRDRTVTDLVLKGRKYQERGAFEDGQAATSAILPGFTVDVSVLFDAAKD